MSSAIEALVERVEKLCTDGPLLLMVDDLQWADDASLLVWQRLSRLADQLPLLLAGTCRLLPRSAALSALRRSLDAHDGVMMALDQLPVDDIDPLVERITGAAIGPDLPRLAREAGGNPLYVGEVVEAYQRAGRIEVVDGTAELTEAADDTSLPVTDVIADRLGFLSEPTFAMLRMAALLGVEFSVGDLSTVIDRPAMEMIGSIEEAVAGGVVVERMDGLAFRHGLFQQAMYDGIPGGLRTALHQQAAKTLDAAGADVQTVAVQLAAAQVPADTWFVEWLVRSADQLAYRAPRVAAELLRRALDGPVDRAGPLGTAVAAGRRCCSCCRSTPRSTSWPRRTWPTRLAPHPWSGTGPTRCCSSDQDDDALRAIDDALADESTSPEWTDRLTALRALILVSAGRLDEAEAAALGVLDSEPADGRTRDPIADAYALHVRMYVASTMRGDDEAALGFVRAAVALVAGDPRAKYLHMMLLGERGGHALRHRPGRRGGSGHPGPAASRRAGRLPAADLQRPAHRGGPLVRRGRWDDAVTELRVLEEDHDRARSPRIGCGCTAWRP